MSQEFIPLGKLITDPFAGKDAVHVAVEPVIVDQDYLSPGEHVCLLGADEKTGLLLVGAQAGGKAVGIIDPYLTEKIKRGDKVYLCLFPNTVTSLRHHWTHPDFPDRDSTETDKKRIARNAILSQIPGAARR